MTSLFRQLMGSQILAREFGVILMPITDGFVVVPLLVPYSGVFIPSCLSSTLTSYLLLVWH